MNSRENAHALGARQLPRVLAWSFCPYRTRPALFPAHSGARLRRPFSGWLVLPRLDFSVPNFALLAFKTLNSTFTSPSTPTMSLAQSMLVTIDELRQLSIWSQNGFTGPDMRVRLRLHVRCPLESRISQLAQISAFRQATMLNPRQTSWRCPALRATIYQASPVDSLPSSRTLTCLSPSRSSSVSTPEFFQRFAFLARFD
jgi:hypothetical protein